MSLFFEDLHTRYIKMLGKILSVKWSIYLTFFFTKLIVISINIVHSCVTSLFFDKSGQASAKNDSDIFFSDQTCHSPIIYYKLNFYTFILTPI